MIRQITATTQGWHRGRIHVLAVGLVIPGHTRQPLCGLDAWKAKSLEKSRSGRLRDFGLPGYFRGGMKNKTVRVLEKMLGEQSFGLSEVVKNLQNTF